ncbi:MAG: HD domain-containing protein [Candidatus Paceibacterota bacterium]
MNLVIESGMNIIEKTAEYVKSSLTEAEGGHDWFHIERVWNLSKHIGQAEGGVDMVVVQLGVLLHDIADSKFHDDNEDIGPRTAREWLISQEVAIETIDYVENIVRNISFKGNMENQQWTSPELVIVQDADRLDAMGAIGIARTFNYGGHKGRALYDPAIKPNLDMTKEEYKKSTAPTLNHFHEKLLLLKDRMNTITGRKMAEGRHEFMLRYLDQFHAEWNGEK